MAPTTQEAGEGAAAGLFTALGYDFWSNPDGFILAVMWDALASGLQGFANGVADRGFAMWAIFDEAVIGGIGSAIGTPGRIVVESIENFLFGVDLFLTDLAAGLGPFGFIVVPVAWSVTAVGSVAVVVGVWRLYKWLRTVVV